MNWFDEDPELLRVALEIIESWDSESFVHGVATTSPSSVIGEVDSNNDEIGSEDGNELTTIGEAVSRAKRPPTAQTSAKAAPRKLKPSRISSARHKRRDEILYLRDKVTDMETELATLQKQKADDGRSERTQPNGVDAAMTVMWQDIAGRQQRQRQKAELEQAKLRGLLETQMKVARGLINLMQKARRIEEDEAFPTTKRAKLSINVSDDISEEDLCGHVDELYHTLDEAFSFAKFRDGTLKFMDVEVQDQGDEDIVIEFRDAWALPFEIDEVVDAVWAFTGKRGELRGDVLRVNAVSGDTFSTFYTGSATVSALNCSFHGKGVSKLFPATAERDAAIISTMYTLPHNGNGGEFEGIRADEDAFLRVVSAQSFAGQSDSRVLSVVQSSRRFRWTFDVDKAPTSRRNAGVLTDSVLDHIKQELQLKHETVETLLLRSQ